MNTTGSRSIGFASLVLLLVTSCDQPKKASVESNASATPHGASAPITVHAPDAFYDPPPDFSRQPGLLLRSEPLKDVTLPTGTRGWRILYTTTVDDSTPATAVATVFAPINAPPGPRPVVAWEHPTTGLLQKCMPSLFSLPNAGIPARSQIVTAGWIVVETDYSFAEKGGPHPYLIGEGEARAALDSIRAAQRMPQLMVDNRVVVWGYSQGGHVALWAGIVAPRYVPELKILGAIAIAPATDLKKILEMNIEVDKLFGPYIAASYSRFYPDIKFEQAVRPEALDSARQMLGLCDTFPQEDAKRLEDLAESFNGRALTTSSNKALQDRLEQNTPTVLIKNPVVIVQGLSDNIVPPSATDAYVDERCSAGQQLEYWTFKGRDHITILQPGRPLDDLLVEWTRTRLAGEPEEGGCVRKSF